MPIHFSLDFTAPFEVGDEIFTDFPYGNQSMHKPTVDKPCVKASIASVKLVISTDPGKALTVTELMKQNALQVERVIYTLIPDNDTFSAFSVDCLTSNMAQPRLFASQEEWAQSQQQGNDSGDGSTQ